jgi:plasmid rolling circle replication initiator protein Rep
MAWICQHGKRTNDYKIILNWVIKLMKNKRQKEAGKGQNFNRAIHFQPCPMFANNAEAYLSDAPLGQQTYLKRFTRFKTLVTNLYLYTSLHGIVFTKHFLCHLRIGSIS